MLVHGLSDTWPLTKSHNACVHKGIVTAKDRNLCTLVPSQPERNASFQSSQEQATSAQHNFSLKEICLLTLCHSELSLLSFPMGKA